MTDDHERDPKTLAAWYVRTGQAEHNYDACVRKMNELFPTVDNDMILALAVEDDDPEAGKARAESDVKDAQALIAEHELDRPDDGP